MVFKSTRNYPKKSGVTVEPNPNYEPTFEQDAVDAMNNLMKDLDAKDRTRSAGRFSSAKLPPARPLFTTPEKKNPELYKKGLPYNPERWARERPLGGDSSLKDPDKFMIQQDFDRSQSRYPKQYGRKNRRT